VDGLEVLQRIRGDSLTRLVPVVIMTSSDEEEDRIASYDLGANSYVRKPVDFSEFARAVKEVKLYWLLVNTPPTP
jgi:two-component system response regulator